MTDFLEVGTIVAAQGLKGELRVYPNSDFPERFVQPGLRWLQYPDASSPQQVELVSGRIVPGKQLYIVRLAGIGDRNAAEALRGAKLLVDASDRLPLEENEYHVADLVGLQVIHRETQRAIGTVTDVYSAGHDLLEVQLDSPPESTSRKKKRSHPPRILIPFVPEIVPIVNIAGGCVEIDPPPGLLEVNLPNS